MASKKCPLLKQAIYIIHSKWNIKQISESPQNKCCRKRLINNWDSFCSVYNDEWRLLRQISQDISCKIISDLQNNQTAINQILTYDWSRGSASTTHSSWPLLTHFLPSSVSVGSCSRNWVSLSITVSYQPPVTVSKLL